jgi:hypothetical protein
MATDNGYAGTGQKLALSLPPSLLLKDIQESGGVK